MNWTQKELEPQRMQSGIQQFPRQSRYTLRQDNVSLIPTCVQTNQFCMKRDTYRLRIMFSVRMQIGTKAQQCLHTLRGVPQLKQPQLTTTQCACSFCAPTILLARKWQRDSFAHMEPTKSLAREHTQHVSIAQQSRLC